MLGRATIRRIENVAVIDLSGGITVEGGAGELRNKIKEVITSGQTRVVLNLRDLNYIDSAGMGEMVGACSTLRSAGGDLKLANPQERVSKLLRLTKLATIFEIFPDEGAAVQSF